MENIDFQLSSLPQELLEVLPKSNQFEGLVVYTVNFGEYDRISPAPDDPQASYICFVDSDTKLPANWVGIYIPKVLSNAWIITRAFKCCPHILFPNANHSLYVDASFHFKKPASQFVNEKCSGPFSAFQHPDRATVDDEIVACLRTGKGTISKLEDFYKSYSNILSSNDYTLVAGGVLYREHDKLTLNRAMELWYTYLRTGVDRDQIALPVALIKAGQKCSLVPDNIYYNEFLIPKPHIKQGRLSHLKWYIAQCLFRCGLRKKKHLSVKATCNANYK